MTRSLRPLHKHPALLLSLGCGTISGLNPLVDALPFYGYCSVGHPTAILPAILLVLAFLAFLGWAGADVLFWLFSPRHRANPLGSILAVPLFLVLFIAAANLGFELRTSALEEFTERMQPTVDAIEAHVARTGEPPDRLTVVPASQMCAEEFRYERDEEAWSLELVLVASSNEDERLRYRSDHGYRERDRIINGWGWSYWLD